MKIFPEKIKIQIDKGDKVEYKGTIYTAKVDQAFVIERRAEQFSGKTIDYVFEHVNSRMQIWAIKKFYPNNDYDYFKIALSKWKSLAKLSKNIRDFFTSYWQVDKIKKEGVGKK